MQTVYPIFSDTVPAGTVAYTSRNIGVANKYSRPFVYANFTLQKFWGNLAQIIRYQAFMAETSATI